jgi:DNA polymerase-3 subunit delta
MGVYLLTGDDESLLRSAVHDLVSQLVGDGDSSLMVDDFEGDDYELARLVDAAQTLPFLADRRVVVGRGIGRFNAEEVTSLVSYLNDPSPSTELVLTGGGGRIPKAVSDAVGSAGGVVTATSAPTRSTDRQTWVASRAEEAGVHLELPACRYLAAWLGEDLGRLDGILATLVSTFGTGVRLDVAEIEPFVGEAGGVPPWDFTDAIDAADTALALGLLQRLLHSGERHPLQVMATLHNHYGRLARLDGIDARSEADAAAAMGIKAGFPARKALATFNRLGGENVRRAIDLLAVADLDLRGGTDLDHETVMEVLVARLSRLRPSGR